MKKVVLTIAALAFGIASFASAHSNNNNVEGVEKSEVVTLTAKLNTTMSLDIDNSPVLFNFVTLDEFRKGMGKYEGEYSSKGTISSTANWNLSYRATGAFTHTDGVTTMPLDNVGLSAKFTGKNHVKNNATGTPLPLTESRTTILGHDGHQSNAGDETDNAFTIYWEMGTKKGNMNNKSIFEQDLKKGEYNTKVEFVASEVL